MSSKKVDPWAIYDNPPRKESPELVNNSGPGKQRVKVRSEEMFASAAIMVANGDFKGAAEMTLSAHYQAILEGKPGANEALANYLEHKEQREAERRDQAQTRSYGRDR